MTNLLELPTRNEQGQVRVVVEVPKGSNVKLKYDPALGVFELERFLAGNRYPYDWGFVPSTVAEDGDPLDALVIHDGQTAPGVVICSVAIGLLRVTQVSDGKEEPVRNDRVIAVPAALPSVRSVLELEAGVRPMLAQFFATVGDLARKRVTVEGWGDAAEAEAAITRASSAFGAARR